MKVRRTLRKKLLDKGEITLEEFKGNSAPSAAEAGGYKRKAYETKQDKNIMLSKGIYGSGFIKNTLYEI